MQIELDVVTKPWVNKVGVCGAIEDHAKDSRSS